MLEMPGQPTNDYRTITQNLWVIVRPKGRGFHTEDFDDKLVDDVEMLKQQRITNP